jgi:hypothetical protein
MLKTIAKLLIAILIGFGGFILARYAEADDAPGGVVIGWLLVLVGVVLAVKAVPSGNHTSAGNT